jgi:hydrogenase maturation protease
MNDLKDKNNILIGIGNDGRGDDALGWLFVERFGENPGWESALRYQLQIEDAEMISQFDTVVFVDASVEEIVEGFHFTRCVPKASTHFSTHKIDPATILWMAREIYGSKVEGYVMAIQGFNWELHLGLSAQAETNLGKALGHFLERVPLPESADHPS